MSFEYLLVKFREDRSVLANGTSVGGTNHCLTLPPGDYEISLDGEPTSPPTVGVELDGTSPLSPVVVEFS
jgi:hypothetical protein